MIIAGNCDHVFYKMAKRDIIDDRRYVCGYCGTLATEGEKILFEAPTGTAN